MKLKGDINMLSIHVFGATHFIKEKGTYLVYREEKTNRILIKGKNEEYPVALVNVASEVTKTVSRSHLKIINGPDYLVLEDLSSQNTTYIVGNLGDKLVKIRRMEILRRLAPTPFEIMLGSLVLQFTY